MGNGAFLVFPQGNGRVHPSKSDVAAIIFAGTGRVHFFVVLAHQSLAALRVSPDPVSYTHLDVYKRQPRILFVLSMSAAVLQPTYLHQEHRRQKK